MDYYTLFADTYLIRLSKVKGKTLEDAKSKGQQFCSNNDYIYLATCTADDLQRYHERLIGI